MARLNGKKIIFSPHVHIEGTDTSDATATAFELLQGYTAYGAEGTKMTGRVVICQSVMLKSTPFLNSKLNVTVKSLKDQSENTYETSFTEKTAQTYNPSLTDQTIPAGVATSGAQTIKAVDATNLASLDATFYADLLTETWGA